MQFKKGTFAIYTIVVALIAAFLGWFGKASTNTDIGVGNNPVALAPGTIANLQASDRNHVIQIDVNAGGATGAGTLYIIHADGGFVQMPVAGPAGTQIQIPANTHAVIVNPAANAQPLTVELN